MNTTNNNKRRRVHEKESYLKPKKKRKLNESIDTKPKEIKWSCHRIWDYDKNGGMYSMKEVNEAKQFYDKYGFAVISNVLNESENKKGKELLLLDLKEINNGKIDDITDINNISDSHIPGWKQTGQRVEFGISCGLFANYSRLNKNVYKIFEIFHDTQHQLCCSLDCVGITTNNTKHGDIMWLHCDQSLYSKNDINKKEDGYNYHNIQSSLYYTDSNEYTVSFVIVPKSHNLYWHDIAEKLKKHNINPTRKHWMGLNQLISIDNKFVNDIIKNKAFRIHCKQNSLIIWNSKCLHQNSNAIKNNNSLNELSRICQFISMCPNKLRRKQGFKTTVCMTINGTTSTQWAQFMFPSSMKHPRFLTDKNKKYFKDLKPRINPKITEKQFQKMIPNSLKNCKVKIYGNGDKENNKKDLTLDTIHCLTLTQLKKFKTKHLYLLIDDELKTIQPWIE